MVNNNFGYDEEGGGRALFEIRVEGLRKTTKNRLTITGYRLWTRDFSEYVEQMLGFDPDFGEMSRCIYWSVISRWKHTNKYHLS